MAISAGALTAELSSCSSLPVYRTAMNGNAITVPLSLFGEGDVHIIRADNYGYDIALRQEQDGSYLALLLLCTHAATQLTSVGDGYSCNLHGSKFDRHGVVTHGPAERPLKRFPTGVSANSIVISLG